MGETFLKRLNRCFFSTLVVCCSNGGELFKKNVVLASAEVRLPLRSLGGTSDIFPMARVESGVFLVKVAAV